MIQEGTYLARSAKAVQVIKKRILINILNEILQTSEILTVCKMKFKHNVFIAKKHCVKNKKKF